MRILCASILKLFIIISGLLLLHQNGLANQTQLVITSGAQFDYAETLFKEKDYETALIEFKRFTHFFPDSPHLAKAKFKIGVCLFNLKKFHDAAKVFNDIIITDRVNDITRESSFFQSKAFMNMGNTGYAQIVLNNFLKLVEDRETKDRIFFNLALIHFEDAKNGKPGALDLARESLMKISTTGADTYHTDQYLSLILKAEQAPQKNPGLAGFFAIVPGGGFLYCERYRDAFVTFLLNAGLIYAAYEAFENDNPALGGIISFVEAGFYSGNIYGSISSAHKYNREKRIRILNEIFYIDSTVEPIKRGVKVSLSYKF